MMAFETIKDHRYSISTLMCLIGNTAGGLYSVSRNKDSESTSNVEFES